MDEFTKIVPSTLVAIIRKLERILIRLYRQNVSLLFRQTCISYIYIYIYIYALDTLVDKGPKSSVKDMN